MADVSLRHQIEEIRRELSVRRRRYPGWIVDGSLRADVGAHRIAALEAVLANLLRLDQPELKL